MFVKKYNKKCIDFSIAKDQLVILRLLCPCPYPSSSFSSFLLSLPQWFLRKVQVLLRRCPSQLSSSFSSQISLEKRNHLQPRDSMKHLVYAVDGRERLDLDCRLFILCFVDRYWCKCYVNCFPNQLQVCRESNPGCLD